MTDTHPLTRSRRPTTHPLQCLPQRGIPGVLKPRNSGRFGKFKLDVPIFERFGTTPLKAETAEGVVG